VRTTHLSLDKVTASATAFRWIAESRGAVNSSPGRGARRFKGITSRGVGPFVVFLMPNTGFTGIAGFTLMV